MTKLFIVLLFFLQSCNIVTAEQQKFIQPNNENIVIKGAFFVKKSSDKVIINRFDNEFLTHKKTFVNAIKANTQSGVTICFSTNSSTITMYFKERDDAQHRQKVFGILKNGEFFKEVKGTTFSFTNVEDNQYNQWEIVLPTFCGVDFTGIEIDGNSDLNKIKQEQKPVYVAIGNSITHGVGQNGAGFLTYPFLLAQNKNWVLYNLAVGGSKISWPVARLIENKKVDVITILWGYNDWNSTFTIENEIKPYYKKLITKLRKIQPDAKIYCINKCFFMSKELIIEPVQNYFITALFYKKGTLDNYVFIIRMNKYLLFSSATAILQLLKMNSSIKSNLVILFAFTNVLL